MDCYTCGNDAAYLFVYKSTIAQTCRELRCELCAAALRDGEQKIIEDKWIGEGDEPTDVTSKADLRRN